MKARDLRAKARGALKGSWLKAMAATLIAGILGGTVCTRLDTTFLSGLLSGSETAQTVPFASQAAAYALAGFPEDIQELLSAFVSRLAGFLTAAAAGAGILGLIRLILGGAISMGHIRFHLKLLKKQQAGIGDVFSRLKYFFKGFWMNFVRGLYVFLWSLLLVIPGIVKAFSYAMTPYILAENPDYSVSKAIKKSRKLMNGNKWRLFCLNLSFLGWHILAALTMGVGYLVLNPYIESANAAFYRQIKAEKRAE